MLRILLIVFSWQLLPFTMCMAQSPSINDLGTSGPEQGNSILQTADGDFVFLINGSINPPINSLTGCTFARTDCNGNILAYKTFAPGQANSGFHLHATADKGFVFLLSTNSSNSNSTFLVKLDSNINVSWCKYLPLRSGYMDGLTLDNAGNIYVVANASVTAVKDEIALLKFTPDGVNIFQQKITYTTGIKATDIKLDDGGRIYISAIANAGINTMDDCVLITCNPAGTVDKSVAFITAFDDEASGIILNSMGDVLLCGSAFSAASGYDCFLIVCDSNLSLKHSSYYDGGAQQYEFWRTIIADGPHSWIAGGDIGTVAVRNMMIAHIDSTYNVDWSKEYSIAPAYTNYLYDGWKCKNGNFSFTGDLASNTGVRQALLLTTDGNGMAPCATNVLTLTKVNTVPSVMSLPLTQTPVTWVPLDTNMTLASLNMFHQNYCGVSFSCLSFSMQKKGACPEQCYTIQNTSSSPPASFWYWDFDGADPPFSLQQNPPVVCFNEKRIYKIKLTVSSLSVTNNLTQELNTEQDCSLQIPNVFSPNSDGINETFEIKNLPQNFHLVIYNRWGKLLFETQDRTKLWDGKVNSSTVPDGVYYYVLSSESFKQPYKGTVTVVK